MISSGELGRSAGLEYEKKIIDIINNPGLNPGLYDIIINEIKKTFVIDNAVIKATLNKTHVSSILNNNLTPPKADITLSIKGTGVPINLGISIKSSNASIQIQVISVDRFKKICEHNNMIFSQELYSGLSKFCGSGVFKPNDDDTKTLNLAQGDRSRFLYTELLSYEKTAISDFFINNQKKLYYILLAEGLADLDHKAEYYLVNTTKYSATQIINFEIQSMHELIEGLSQKTGFTSTDKGSFSTSDITVQMKGSGKGESYHYLQFNLAYKGTHLQPVVDWDN